MSKRGHRIALSELHGMLSSMHPEAMVPVLVIGRAAPSGPMLVYADYSEWTTARAALSMISGADCDRLLSDVRRDEYTGYVEVVSPLLKTTPVKRQRRRARRRAIGGWLSRTIAQIVTAFITRER